MIYCLLKKEISFSMGIKSTDKNCSIVINVNDCNMLFSKCRR